VKDNKMKKPILIGHSLGAFMTLWLHSTEPDLFGKSICVDGLPFVSAIGKPDTTAEAVKANPQFNKEAVIQNFKSLPSEGYVKNMTKAMLYQVNDSTRAKQFAEWSYKSDRTTLGSTIVEMSTTDLRKDISKIKAPVLVMASIFGTKEVSEKEYNLQYAELKNKTIKVADAKHFIMYDQPQWFYQEIEAFLQAN
jgi:pimeloyl-ACP methyl ester carboxylesterase